MSNYSPIVLFVYNRPIHTERTITALAENTLAINSDLFIYSDAPKNDAAIDGVNEVRNLIKKLTGFKSITIIEREVNFGLVKSISEGVTSIVNTYGKIIVVEDDLVTHKQFLEYINAALDLYENKKGVYEITGYSHLDREESVEENPSYFLKITSTWGWATWADRWTAFADGLNGVEALSTDSALRHQFNYDSSYNYFKMVKDGKSGKVKSWGIVWYWNIFKRNGLTLHPLETLVDQIGFDGTGENAKNYVVSTTRLKPQKYQFVFPSDIQEGSAERKLIVSKLKKRKLLLIFKVIAHKLGIKTK